MRIGSSVGTMKIGSTAVAAIQRGTDRVYDADVAAFQKASAASDVSGILDLVDYLKAESLWNYARFYPMKSAQNAGTGSTVYGLGGLTTNNMTLVNSPTWGSDGVTFASASTQYATAGDFLSDADPARFIFFRGTLAGTHADGSTRSFVSQWKDPDGRGTLFGYNNLDGRISLFRTSDGTSGTQERYDGSDSLFSGIDVCAVAKFSLASRFLWANKTSVPVSLISGSAQSTTADSSGLVVVGNIDGFTGAPSQLDDVSMVGFIEGSDLTTTQRETITDLINAL